MFGLLSSVQVKHKYLAGLTKAMKVLVEAYGCTLNHGESEEFIEKILEQGHDIVANESEADAFAIFTCGVIETTEKHMLKRIGQLALDSSKSLLVCGCLGNINPEAIMEIAPHARMYGPSEQIRASKYFDDSDKSGIREFDSQPKIGILPIATGCLGNCSYCITKKARGPLQSRPVQEIKQRLEMLVARGCAEIQVCAQDTASYGQDIDESLESLIKELETVHGNFMIRIGMMNPASLERNLQTILRAYESDKVFKFLHLPLQSGSNSILEAMNRGHTSQDYDRTVTEFRRKFPDLALSTDIIVGFPGETDNDFQASVILLHHIRPDIINITKFSSRPSTEANEMENQVFGGTIKKRSKDFTDLRFELTGINYKALFGKKIRALATECLVEGTTFMRTQNYRPILIPDKLELGKWYEIEITGVERVYLTGKLIAKMGHNV